MFDHRHFVPALKAKEGEFWALGHLDANIAKLVTPLLEIIPSVSKDFKVHIRQNMKSMGQAWGESPFFLDTHFVPGASYCDTSCHAAYAVGLHAIPVVKLSDPAAMLKVAKASHERNQRGIALKIRHSDLDQGSLRDCIAGLLKSVGMEPGHVDILIDYTFCCGATILSKLPTHIGALPNLKEWRTLTALSGSFPQSLADFPRDHWSQIPREEWKAWKKVVSEGMTARIPAYGDYGVRDPELPPKGGRASANLRYTTSNSYFIRAGGQISRGHATDIWNIAKTLVKSPEFKGEKFSAGDKEIYKVASGTNGTGGAQQWIQWCMNHHIVFVTNEIVRNIGT